MACECDWCQWHRIYKDHMKDIKEAGLVEAAKFMDNFIDHSLDQELELDIAQSVIDGSWPQADKVIETARHRRQAELEVNKDG